MKFTIRVIIFLVVICAPASIYSDVISDPLYRKIKVFDTQSDVKGWKGIVKGEVLSFSSRERPDENDLSGNKQDRTKVTVRLYDSEGLKEGNFLYIVNSENLVVGKLKIRIIFKSATFGHLLIGYGAFILCKKGDRVVSRITDEYSKYSYIHKSRGDYYSAINETGKAIAEYKKAIKLDRGSPEAHFALGEIYFEQNLFQFAFHEYLQAYKRIGRFYDNEDKFRLLKGMTDIRFREVFYSYLTDNIRKKFREEGIKYGKEALKIFPDSEEVNYMLGMFYYKKPGEFDRIARDYFLKVISIDPAHVESNIALSELYMKHRNRKKAAVYAKMALTADPGNRRARQLLKYIKKYNVP